MKPGPTAVSPLAREGVHRAKHNCYDPTAAPSRGLASRPYSKAIAIRLHLPCLDDPHSFRPGDDSPRYKADEKPMLDDARYHSEPGRQRLGVRNAAEGRVEDVVPLIRDERMALRSASKDCRPRTPGRHGRGLDSPAGRRKAEPDDLDRQRKPP